MTPLGQVIENLTAERYRLLEAAKIGSGKYGTGVVATSYLSCAEKLAEQINLLEAIEAAQGQNDVAHTLLETFFKGVAALTLDHQVVADQAVVFAADLGAALERVNPQWYDLVPAADLDSEDFEEVSH